jgi:hypothetical protein
MHRQDWCAFPPSTHWHWVEWQREEEDSEREKDKKMQRIRNSRLLGVKE